MTLPAALPAEAPAKPRFPTMGGFLADHFWILLCPLLALALMRALWDWSPWSDLEIYAVMFAVVVTGHHMPGWLRAFGEPAVYQKHKAQLWVSFAAIPLMLVVPAWFGFGVIAAFVVAVFDLWHVSMQQHGFGRIYGAKSGDVARFSARLDLACVLVWYLTAVAWSDAWMHGIAGAFRRAGLPLFQHVSPEVWGGFKLALAVASVGLFALYVVTAVRLWQRERRFAGHKHLLHLVAFGVLFVSYQDASWYRAQSVQNLFHALQYFFIVWIFGHLSTERDPDSPKAFYKKLFSGRLGLLPYALLIALYGGGAWFLSTSTYRFGGTDGERTIQVLGSIALASLLLHYYVDSFIWKVRAKDVRSTLGISAGAAKAAGPDRSQVRGAAHACLYFGGPMLLVAVLGAGHRHPSEDAMYAVMDHEATLFPRSAAALTAKGLADLHRGERARGRAALERAFALSPTTKGAAATLARLAQEDGDVPAQLAYLETEVANAPADVALRYQLASALSAAQRVDEAERELLEVVRRDPRHALAHQNLGVVCMWREDESGALERFRQAVTIDPDFTLAVTDLARVLGMLGRNDEALSVLATYRGRNPEDPTALALERELRGAAGG